MLKTLDVLIGFTLIMLIVSMVATIVTQFLITWLNVRGAALRTGVGDLLSLMDRGLKRADAKRIADHLLRNPLIGQPSLLGTRRLAAAVHREELTKLVLDFAASGDAEKMSQEAAQEVAGVAPADASTARSHPDKAELKLLELQKTMRNSLAGNGLELPAAKLKAIRTELLRLEESMPHLSNDARETMALLKHASSEFLAKLNGWFDQTMDRVTDAFTVRARFLTVAVAVILAFALQLDSISLINRLSLDETTRNALVSRALHGSAGPDPQAQVAPDPSAGAGGVLANIADDPGIRDLTRLRLIDVPTSTEDWWRRWNESPPLGQLPGILLSAALLSLGAPFWYELLKNMVKLRSVVAAKDDRQRTERQSTQSPVVALDLAAPGNTARGP